MGKVYYWIELPQDEWGNRAYTNSQAMIIKAEITGSDGKGLKVLGPPEFVKKWPTLRNYGSWTLSNRMHEGPISEQELSSIIWATPHLQGTWQAEAAARRARGDNQ